MPIITNFSQIDPNASYSYADYLTWRFDEAVELIRGKISLMCPAPNVRHQQFSVYLSSHIFFYFQNTPCQVFSAPFDVRLYDRKKSLLASQEITTVVQPDICVICDPDKLDEQGCNGAPDWVIEIVSKSTAKNDVQAKHALYAECGVTEYWLVFPYEEIVQQFVLPDNANHYQLHNNFANDDQAVSYLFPELAIDLAALFKETG